MMTTATADHQQQQQEKKKQRRKRAAGRINCALDQQFNDFIISKGKRGAKREIGQQSCSPGALRKIWGQK